MAGDDGTGQRVPVVAGPSVVPGGRPAHHGGVGRTPGDDDVGAAAQRLDDPPATEVRVGTDEAARVADGLAGFEVREIDTGGDEFVEPAEDVVAAHVRDGGREAEPVGNLGDGLGAAVGVETAGVGDDLDAAVEARAHDLFHLGDEAARVAAARSLRLGASEDEHR